MKFNNNIFNMSWVQLDNKAFKSIRKFHMFDDIHFTIFFLKSGID